MATDTRGVFALIEVVDVALSDGWVNLADVWISPSPAGYTPNTGYFSGGTGSSTMDKLSYSTSTTSPASTANLITQRNSHAATGNSTNGYFGGGSPGPLSSIDKLTYATDITAAAPGANLSVARNYLAATGNSTNGYFGGGSTMDKITYSTDTPSPVPSGANLSVARDYVAATGNSTAGYFGGGFTGSPLANYDRMDKLVYSTDTTTYTPGANLSAPRKITSATGNSTVGYFGGGNGNSGITSRIDKLTYSIDTTAVVPSVGLSVARQYIGATGNSIEGYFGGGTGPGPTPSSRMDKLIYVTDTALYTPNANLSGVRDSLAASSARANALPSVFSSPASPAYKFSDGSPGTPPAFTPTTKTTTTTSYNSGYFGGGDSSTAPIETYSTMDKLSYATDTTTYTPSANLVFVNASGSATGSSSAGYFFGGQGGQNSSIHVLGVQKITYATDSTTYISGGTNYLISRYGLGATGNSTAGYFGGGFSFYGGLSNMDKLTYSEDTIVYTPSANLSSNRNYLTATGNSTAGYFGGGYVSTVPASTMDKLTYSTDTTTPLPSTGNLSVSRGLTAATGNSTEGYFSGGSAGVPTPTYYSTMDKITYSTDTRTYVPGANLRSSRYSHAATGNSTNGYFGGGSDGIIAYSTMDKLTYSTTTTAPAPSGANLSIPRRSPSAVSARANALPQPTATISNIV